MPANLNGRDWIYIVSATLVTGALVFGWFSDAGELKAQIKTNTSDIASMVNIQKKHQGYHDSWRPKYQAMLIAAEQNTKKLEILTKAFNSFIRKQERHNGVVDTRSTIIMQRLQELLTDIKEMKRDSRTRINR